MSHATEVAAAGNEMIQLRTITDSGKAYYSIGDKVTVVWYGGPRPLVCLSCRATDCSHTKRIAQYREEMSP